MVHYQILVLWESHFQKTLTFDVAEEIMKCNQTVTNNCVLSEINDWLVWSIPGWGFLDPMVMPVSWLDISLDWHSCV